MGGWGGDGDAREREDGEGAKSFDRFFWENATTTNPTPKRSATEARGASRGARRRTENLSSTRDARNGGSRSLRLRVAKSGEFFGGDRRARILYRDALPVGYLTTRRALGSPRRDGKTASDCDEHLRKILTKLPFFSKIWFFFGRRCFWVRGPRVR